MALATTRIAFLEAGSGNIPPLPSPHRACRPGDTDAGSGGGPRRRACVSAAVAFSPLPLSLSLPPPPDSFYDRLTDRGNAYAKRRENVEEEVPQVVLDEATAAFPDTPRLVLWADLPSSLPRSVATIAAANAALAGGGEGWGCGGPAPGTPPLITVTPSASETATQTATAPPT